MQMCLKIYIFIATICSTTALFKWIEFDDRFDCLVGIAIDGKPAGIGVFMTRRVVLTSANPLQNYLTEETKDDVSLYVINGKYNEDKEYTEFNCMITVYGKDRRSYWLEHGTDSKHSPLHDLMFITVALRIEQRIKVLLYGITKKLRMPFRAQLAGSAATFQMDKGWSFASFAYIDKQHVEESTELEAEFLDSEVLENCHEWIPKDWGYFICISMDEDYVGIQSGTPLFHDDKVFGIACFSIKKMNRTILVFTDVRPYFTPFCRKIPDDYVNDAPHSGEDELL